MKFKSVISIFVVIAILCFPMAIFAADSYEPNNSFDTAVDLTPGGSSNSISSYISTSDDEDYYKFTVNKYIYVRFSAPDNLSYEMKIYDKNFNPVNPVQRGFSQAGETYYIKIKSVNGAYSADKSYSLILTTYIPPIFL